jgi:NAD+ kinase
MKIAIHGRRVTPEMIPYINEIFEELNKKSIDIVISKEFKDKNRDCGFDLSDYASYSNKQELQSVNFIFSLGGDGTLLETITHIDRLEIPILGINMGRLGFLATIAKTNVKTALKLFYDGKYELDQRSLIHIDSTPNVYGDLNYALNEFAIMKKDSSSMVVVNCYIDGEYLNTYWADGLMVSTPTGSTGYSLSCGGPVVLPQSRNFIITPVSPHNLNVRPMVVSDSSVISFEIENRGVNFLTSLDSRSYTVDNKVKLSVRKENFTVKLIKLEGYTFLDTLRNKLNWGYDSRN